MRFTIRYLLLFLALVTSIRFLYTLRRGIFFEEAFMGTIGYVDLPWPTIISFEFRDMFTWGTIFSMIFMILLCFRKQRPFWATPFSAAVLLGTMIMTTLFVEAYFQPFIEILKIYRGS